MHTTDTAEIARQAREVLRKHWGYDDFRPTQLDIITSVMQGNDTIGLLPTGGGKSITFQVPAMMLDGLTVVITPLISLMKDQADNLARVGIRATYIHAAMSSREHRLAIDRCRLGRVKVLYLSPERLQSQSFLEAAAQFDISLIVVDEAHCISQWGYDFRPSYLRIGQLRAIFPAAPVLALTASATPDVVTDIMLQLRFRNRQHLYARSFHRPNLSYIVRQCNPKDQMLLQVLGGVSGSAIVYVRSRRRTAQLAQALTTAGISATFYHAGLPPAEKDRRQESWHRGFTRVIVATNAFGMGIDKPDVRLVVHYDLPSSLEEYYQEAGRAGRDGQTAYAVILANTTDRRTLQRRLADAFPSVDFVRRVYELVGNYLGVAVGEGYGRNFEFATDQFCHTYHLPQAAVRGALGLLTQAGYIDYADPVTTRSRLIITMQRHELYTLRLEPFDDRTLNTLLRLYPGLFADYVNIDESQLARNLASTETQVYESLITLRRHRVIDYVPRQTSPRVIYTTSRELPRHVQLPTAVYDDRRRLMERRIRAMERFTFGSDICRSNVLLHYFGQTPAADCGHCDVCRDRRARARAAEPGVPSAEATVMYLAGQPGGHTAEYMVRQSARPRQEVVDAVRQLLDRGKVKLTADGRITRVDSGGR